MSITRSTGIEVAFWGPRPGGGYSGITPELDAEVVKAATLLHERAGKDIEIRFNSDRMSGGAYLQGAEGVNSLGVSAGLYREEPSNDLPWDEWKRQRAVAPMITVVCVLAGKNRLLDPSLAERGPTGMEYALIPVQSVDAALQWIESNCRKFEA